MSSPLGPGGRVCTRWVHWYTRHLPVDLATARREEIASDLWEQSTDRYAYSSRARLEFDVIRRFLFGMPADLAWRHHALASTTAKGHPMTHRLAELTNSRSWTTLLALLGAAFLLVVGTALVITGTDEGTTEGRIYGAVALLGGAALLAGVHSYRSQSLSRPAARTLVVTGAIVLGVGFWWFVFLPAIVAILVIYFGVIRGDLETRPTAT